jgi:hypothetical protein
MPLPTSQQVHVDSALTDFSIGFAADFAKDYVAMTAATMKKVGKQSDYYSVWDQGDLFRSEMRLRGESALSVGGGQRLSHTRYNCDTYALHTYVSDRARANADVDVDQAAVRYLTTQAMLKRDLVFAAAAFGTGLWTSNTEQTGVSSGPSSNQFVRWDDSSSTPRYDILEQYEVVAHKIGRVPNTMVCGPYVAQALLLHSNFQGLTQYISGAPSLADVAKACGLERIIVGRSSQTTSKEGATTVMADVYGKHAWLGYIDPTPNMDAPTAITQFSWSDFDRVSGTGGVAVDSWYDNDRRATKYECEASFDVAITSNSSGVFFYTAVA